MNRGRRSIKNNQILCGQCKMVVKESEEESIECDKVFHVQCTMLDKRKYEHLVKHEEEDYECHFCDNSSDTFKTELVEIKTELKKLDQLSAMHEAITFMSKQYDDILRGVAENKNKIESIQKENKQLKNEVKTLKNSTKFLSDHRVKNDCLITGVEVPSGSTAADAVLKLTKEVGVVIQPESIDEAYVVKKKRYQSDTNRTNQSEKQTVVVKFATKTSKDKMMSVKPILKGNESFKNIFVNDYLSKESINLLNYARTLKTVGYRSAYAVRGSIFVKRSELSKPKFIPNEEEVDRLLLEATTNRTRGRRSQPEAAERNGPVDDDIYVSP